jgi:hypothetical protein
MMIPDADDEAAQTFICALLICCSFASVPDDVDEDTEEEDDADFILFLLPLADASSSFGRSSSGPLST